MKKLMLFIVCLIPFVLIFTIQFSSVYVEKTKYVAVEKIVFTQDSMYINKTSSDDVVLDFQASVYPLAATNKKVEYVSSDTSIATVDQAGKITFVNFGVVTITAISDASELLRDSCIFYITDNKVHKIEILEKPELMKLGETATIKHKIIPNEAADKTVTYSSSNTSVLTVAPNGKVSAVGKGSATITLQSVNNVSVSFDVEVVVPVSDVQIDYSTKSFITGNAEFELSKISFKVLPDNANNKNVTFISSNTEIAEVVDNQKIVFKQKGEVQFTIKTEDGNKTDTFVVDYTGGYFLSASIKDEFKNISVEFEKTTEILLEYNLYPLDADLNNVTFESSNENVATVDNTGKITICGGGETVVKMIVQTGNQPIESVSNISVSRKATSILAEDKKILEPTTQIEYQVLPNDHTSSIEFSLNSDIATITQSGFLSFKKQGSVYVTIATSCGQSKTILVEYEKADATNIHIIQNNQQVTLNYLDSCGFVFDSSLEMGIASYSFDENLIEFDAETDVFTVKKGGTTTIVAKYKDKEISIIIEIIRKAEEVKILSEDFDLTQTVVTAKKQVQLSAEVLPVDSTNKTVVWSSSNNDIAQVTNGVVNFKTKGTVTISATVDGRSSSVTIRSTFGNPDSFKLLNESCLLPDILETFKIEISDTFSPSDVVKSELVVTYRSLNQKVATVLDDGTVTAVGVGTTKIVVQIGDATKEFDVSVQAKTKSVAILFDGEEISTGNIVGSSVQLSCVVMPDYATQKDVTWVIVDGETIASVSENGVLNFTGFGSVTVSVTTNDSGKTDTVEITRIKEITNIKLFDKNDNLITSSANYDSTNIPKIVITPDETENLIVRVQLVAEGLLDPQNVDIGAVLASVVSADDGLTLTITKDEQNKDYYSISRGEINKKSLATIKFSYLDNSAYFQVEYRHLKSLTLALKNEDDINFGLEGKRVFATKTYDATSSSSWTNKFVVEYTRYPENNQDTLYWSVDSIYAVVNDGILEVDPDNLTQETQITVTVWFDGVSPVSYTYTFVGGDCVNVSNQEGLDWAIYVSKTIVLQSSLGTDEDNDGGAYSPLTTFSCGYEENSAFVVHCKVYGNGYTINLNNAKGKSGIVITFNGLRNVTIKGENFDEDKGYKNTISLAKEIEYCRIQQMKKMWVGPGSDNSVIFKNCIFKHASQCGLQIGYETAGEVYLENTIFADVAQAAVDYQNGDLKVKGIFDVYNFCTPDVFSTGKTAIKDAYKDENFEEYVYKPEGKEKDWYVNDWEANIAIAILPPSITNLTVAVSDVYFWNEDISDYEYIGNGTENTTGLGYKKIANKYLGITVYLITPPIESSYIKHDSELTTEGESKVYSPQKLEAYKKSTATNT